MEPLIDTCDRADSDPGVAPELPAGELHVWTVPVPANPASCAHYWRLLSAEERNAGAAFRRAGDMRRYVVAHGELRIILAGYTGLEPAALEFLRAGPGKPALKNGGNIRFNIAHSGDAALVAVGRDREVGVDAELVRFHDDLPLIAARCYAPREIGLLRSCASGRYAETFFRIWARKEAYIKARGEGLSLDLRTIDAAEAPAVLDGRWHLADIGSYRGCACALAADGPIGRVRIIGGPA